MARMSLVSNSDDQSNANGEVASNKNLPAKILIVMFVFPVMLGVSQGAILWPLALILSAIHALVNLPAWVEAIALGVSYLLWIGAAILLTRLVWPKSPSK